MAENIFVIREVERKEWDDLWSKVDNNNLLQSWEYGEAKRLSESWTPSRYVFENIDGEQVAIVQVLARTLPLIGGIARVNRGPLFLSKKIKESPSIYLEILRSLLALKKIKRWWFFFIAPEINKDQIEGFDLRCLGLKLRKASPWGSTILDLTPGVDDLKKNLNGKWRNLLRKSQKSGLSVRQINGKHREFESLIVMYEDMQKDKGFSGMPSELLRELGRLNDSIWSLSAYVGELTESEEATEEIAGMLISIRHGNTATYLIGHTGYASRKTNVNYLLLWQAILDAKSDGCQFFDLGGLNSNTPKGVAHFKRGLSGAEYELCGEFIAKIF
jgi:lipid II:glycine glycyltransferase (peptidoglycan interpeptide bridge formation enzyme)